MQTFLPFPDYEKSASVLDRQRLGKQRVEAKQIVLALYGLTTGWVNHPATRMWRGYEMALCEYGEAVCREWISRGYNDSLLGFFVDMQEAIAIDNDDDITAYPPWHGKRDFHRSHKSNLLRKDPEWYGRYFRNIPDDLPYVWPM